MNKFHGSSFVWKFKEQTFSKSFFGSIEHLYDFKHLSEHVTSCFDSQGFVYRAKDKL